MTNIDKLNNMINALYERAENKDDIAELSTINETIKAVKEDFSKMESDYKEVFNDYKEMVKHTAFVPTVNQEVRDVKEPPKFQDFFKHSGNLQ